MVSEFSDREPHTFFGHVAALSVEDRNELDEYLTRLPEFKEWDETGFRLSVKQKLLTASVRSGAAPESVDRAFDQILLDFREYKELAAILRGKVKAWCRAMADDPA